MREVGDQEGEEREAGGQDNTSNGWSWRSGKSNNASRDVYKKV